VRLAQFNFSKLVFFTLCLSVFLCSTAFYSVDDINVKQNASTPGWAKVKDYFKPKPNDKDFATNGALSEVLNEDGTIKKGAEGSFDPRGYNMTYGANGQPIFKPMGAGDERWQPMPNLPVGVNGRVYAIAVTSSGVYIGGSFTSAGGVTVSNIAFWNGSAWQALSAGVNGRVNALAVSGSTLYVGGEFTTAGGATANRIAVWDGTTWVATIGSVTGTRINSIAISGTNIFIGGLFTSISGVPANNVAKWNGVAWSSLTTGTNGEVLVVEASASSIYVGGSFTTVGGNIARAIALWNDSTTSWATLGTTFGADNGAVYAIAISGSNVYVGGNFTSIRGISANRIALWNGTNWSALGTTGLDTIYSIYVSSSSEIYAGGFSTLSTSDLVRWNGTTWADSGDLLSGIVFVLERFITSFDFLAGGDFSTLNNGVVVNNIARPIGQFSRRLGPIGYGVNVDYNGGSISAITISGSNVYVGGRFRTIGPTAANNVAVWNGTSWNALGSGTNGLVSAIAISGSNVYVGGQFTSAGGVSVNNIALWNGSSWSTLCTGTGLTGGGGFGTFVLAIEVVGTDVFVGGNFTNAGGVSASRIARWNGSSWSALSSGLTGSSSDFVYKIKSYNGGIVVVGRFTTAGSTPSSNIAFWNGSTWSTFGAGLNAVCYALHVHNNGFYVGGDFTSAGGVAAERVSFYNGTTWSALGAGVSLTVNDIFVRANNVYVVGTFTSAGGNSANRIAVWNGQSWSTLGTGLNNTANVIAGTSSNLYVGGFFNATGDGSLGALGIIQRNGLVPVPVLQAPTVLPDPKGIRLNATISPGGISGTYYFEYGTAENSLTLLTASANMSGSADINVSADVFSGTPNSTYFYRLRVQNDEGISYSPIQSYKFPSDIEVRQNTTTFASGSEYDFGNVNFQASSTVISFSIHNLGLADLTLSGTPGNYIVKGGAHPDDFAVVQNVLTSPLAFNTSQNFSIQFNPQSGGVRTATLTITSNDPNESPYIINVKGTGIKLNQTVTFNALTPRTFGNAPFALSATSTSGLPVSFSSGTPSVASISGNTVTILAPGTTVITASQAGNTNYNAATSVQQTLIVYAAEPTAQPTNLTFNNPTTSSINGAFTAAAGSPSGYLVLRRLGSAPTSTPVDGTAYTNGSTLGDATVVSSSAATTFADAGLVAGTTYHYAVYAFNGSGVTANYRTTTPLVNSTITVPPAPVAAAASLVTQTSFRANWNAAAGATEYQLFISSNNFVTLLTGSEPKTVSGLNDVITGLNPGITYQYKVRSKNGQGVSIDSNVIIQITTPPTPVVNVAQNVGTNDFKITWTAVTGASGYQIDVSSNNFTSFIRGYQNKSVGNVTEEIVTGLSPFTSYQFRIRSTNNGGTSSNSNVGIVTTLSANSPLTISNPVYTAATSKISVTLANGTGARIVKFYSRGITQVLFRSAETITSATNTYEVTVAPTLLDELGLEYYFTAEDAVTTAPKRSPENSNAYLYKPITQGQIKFPGLSFGGNIQNYRIISIPYALTINSPGVIFSPLGAYDKTKWRLLQLSGTTFTDNPSAMVPGRAYWFNAKESAPIELGAGSVVQSNQSTDFIFSLQQGWNMIATPFPFTITWEDVVDANPTANVDADYLVFNPNSIGYDASNSMRPFEGGFVFANASTQLKFPVVLKNGIAGRSEKVKVFERNLDAATWELPLKLQQGIRENNLIGLGMHEEATTGKDKFDRATLPTFLDQPELYSESNDVFAPYLLRNIVNNRSNHSWTFKVLAKEGEPVILSWDNEAIRTNQSQLILYDKEANVLLDMRTTGSYTFIPTKNHELQFVYSKEEITFNADFELASPNPFSTEIKLPGYFNVHSQTTSVHVSIKNAAGVEVFSTTYQLKEAGLHQPTWSGSGHAGEHLANGFYLYQITYKNGTAKVSRTGKIIKQ
jgi:hypothetical protein